MKKSYQKKLGKNQGKSLKLEDVDWRFKNADTAYLTHGLHSYPARMIPQIPSALLDYFMQKGVLEKKDTLYDPFVGSGTSAVEAHLHGLHFEGNDINPFAVMLTLAKSTPLDLNKLKTAQRKLLERIKKLDKKNLNMKKPEDINEGWFPEPQIFHLVQIRNILDEISEEYCEDIARFFRICLSKTVRKTSYQRNGEFKRYRIPEKKREKHDPDVFSIFRKAVKKNFPLIKKYSDRVNDKLDCKVHLADSRFAEDVKKDSADIVITSPPYGDHKTTVAYGQFSRDLAILSSDFGKKEMLKVDKEGLGGKIRKLESQTNFQEYSESLSATLDTLKEKDGRYEDALNFFRDYFEVMKQVKRILRPRQPVAWVVANRTISRINIPTHLITKELCEYLGFKHKKTLPRKIPNKTLPWKNAPENISGKKGGTMAKENIVILTNPSE